MKRPNRIVDLALMVGAFSLIAPAAFAQIPYNPPSATRPPPNVMLVLDGSKTTMINGQNCRGICHVEGTVDSQCGGAGGEYDCNIYRHGETRLQLARRVLTGGWGWDTAFWSSRNGFADGHASNAGVMDQYRGIRWGLMWYDGLGTRIAMDPTGDNIAAQRAVINFGIASNEWMMPPAARPSPALNSWFPFARTRLTGGQSWDSEANDPGCSGTSASPLTCTSDSNSRQSRALETLHDYWALGQSPTNFTAGPLAAGAALSGVRHFPNFPTPMSDPNAPDDQNVIDGDPANVLVSPGTAGCRRNIGIMLLDGHGGARRNGTTWADLYYHNGRNVAEQAARIVDLGGATVRNDPEKRNQVFAIRFGSIEPDQNYSTDLIADYGYDGVPGGGGITRAFDAAPGGQITDLTLLYAAFSSIFSLVFDGSYNGAAPIVTIYGDRMALTSFLIQDCAGRTPTTCNIGRPGSLGWVALDPTTGQVLFPLFDAGAVLRTHDANARNIWSTRVTGGAGYAHEANCGVVGSCASRSLAPVQVTNANFSGTGFDLPILTPDPLNPLNFLSSGTGSDIDFLRGVPTARFANGPRRADTDGDDVIDDTYKLTDIANSQPVVVGAPVGVGEDIERWNAFLNVNIVRNTGANGDGTTTRVRYRDQVIYVGGNDGMLHAFLAARNTGVASTQVGRVSSYVNPPACAPGSPSSQQNHNYCMGNELWGYAPRMLQPYWRSLRGGSYYMVDGSPVVQDVLFTKGLANPGTVCTAHNQFGCGWEYRTVLLQCLGGGGPGCFAIDVTNPFASPPNVLWERQMPGILNRGTSTSRPQIARVRRIIGGVSTPYYVGLMGGGLGENNGSGVRRGTFIAIGLEDGQVYNTTAANAARADYAGAPTCLDTNFDSFVDTCYIATTTADVYKVRLPNGSPVGMTQGLFFDGRMAAQNAGFSFDNDPNTATPAFPSAYSRVVATFDVDKRLNLYYGTGNFEDIQNPSEQNFFFKIRDLDPAQAPTWSVALNAARQASSCENANGTTFPGASGTDGVLPLQTGEKILFDPVISNGTTFFTSYRPNTNPCIVGDGFLYGINHDTCEPGVDTDNDGTADSDRVAGFTGLPASPTINEASGTVMMSMDRGQPIAVAARTPPALQVPMLKLWWRRLAF